MKDQWRRRLLAFQSGYYGVTGIWPILYLRSFEAITGPKIDDWLVHMVALQICLIAGLALTRRTANAGSIT